MTTKVEITPAIINEQIAALKAQVEQLQLRARGTRDVVEQARVAVEKSPLPERVRALLLDRPRGVDDLARELREPAGRVATAVRGLRDKLYNAGTETGPAWFAIVGDESSTAELSAAIQALARYRPMTFADLQAATGARHGRISGAIVALQRGRTGLVNLGTSAKARWFIVPPGTRLSKITT